MQDRPISLPAIVSTHPRLYITVCTTHSSQNRALKKTWLSST